MLIEMLAVNKYRAVRLSIKSDRAANNFREPRIIVSPWSILLRLSKYLLSSGVRVVTPVSNG